MGYKSHTLFRLLEDIDANQLLLPHIQRPFVWQTEQMAKLFDSLMRNYPIQTLLFWRTREAIRARKFMPLIEMDTDLSKFYDKPKSSEGVEKTFVLDGQQRLQTLHCIFRGGVLEEGGQIAQAYVDITAGAAPIEDGESLFSLKFNSDGLPLPWFRIRDLSEKYARRNASDIADEINDAVPCESSSDTRKQRERRVRKNIAQLDALLYTDKFFWADELDGVAGEFPYRRILEIFVRVNSGGTKLSRSDLMFSAMKEGWEDIEERVEQTVDLLDLDGRLAVDGELILKALVLLHGDGPEVGPEKFQGATGEALLARMDENWDRAERAFHELRDFMIHTLRLSSDRLIRSYNALIILFDFLYNNPRPGEAARASMSAFFHKAQLFGWFSSQTDATLRVLHKLVGSAMSGKFPLTEIMRYFEESRSAQVELTQYTLDDARVRPILLNIVYIDRWGTSPFDVASKGNEPHVDHIYPQHMLRSKLNCRSDEINDIGNLRFLGATDNIRKRAELPASYFNRLRAQGVPIDRHILVEEFYVDPARLAFDKATFGRFRSERRAAIWRSLKRVVDLDLEAEPLLPDSSN